MLLSLKLISSLPLPPLPLLPKSSPALSPAPPPAPSRPPQPPPRASRPKPRRTAAARNPKRPPRRRRVPWRGRRPPWRRPGRGPVERSERGGGGGWGGGRGKKSEEVQFREREPEKTAKGETKPQERTAVGTAFLRATASIPSSARADAVARQWPAAARAHAAAATATPVAEAPAGEIVNDDDVACGGGASDELVEEEAPSPLVARRLVSRSPSLLVAACGIVKGDAMRRQKEREKERFSGK